MVIVPVSVPCVVRRVAGAAVLAFLFAAGGRSLAEPKAVQPGDPPSLTTTIVYLTKDYQEPPPLSLVDKEVKDKGIQGARIALEEDNRTGRVLGQHYDLLEVLLPATGNPAEKAKELLAQGHGIIVADLEAQDLLAVS